MIRYYCSSHSCAAEHTRLVNECRAKLGLAALSHEPNISRQQMASCCQRLVRLVETATLSVDLRLCRVKVAQFYSVMADGDLCIPWNFEDVF